MARRNSHSDPYLEQIVRTLQTAYRTQHPHSKVEAKRQNSVSVHVRIIDPDFERMDRSERDELVWSVLESNLPEETVGEVTMLLLFTPQEAKRSLMNREFDEPVNSQY